MAAGKALVFSGVRWAAARIQNRHVVPSIESVLQGKVSAASVPKAQAGKPAAARRRAGTQPVKQALTPATIFTLELPGGGRAWETTQPQAFWRGFAEINFVGGDGEDVLRFMQRHGDPFDSVLSGGRVLETFNWIWAVHELKKVAQAWEPADESGVSRLTDETGRLYLAKNTLEKALAGVIDTFSLTSLTGLDLVPRALNLHAFMVGSAASAFEEQISMRRCAHCADWFQARRKDMRFCSDSCRSSSNAVKGE